MRTHTFLILASLFAVAILAGCTSNPQQSTGPTVTTPNCGASATENANSTEGANNTASQGVGNGACETSTTTTPPTTNETNSTTNSTNSTNSTGGY